MKIIQASADEVSGTIYILCKIKKHLERNSSNIKGKQIMHVRLASIV
jgi:hypothetical protein